MSVLPRPLCRAAAWATVTVLLWCPRSAWAEIFVWIRPDGVIVLSDRRASPRLPTVAVHATTRVRVRRAADSLDVIIDREAARHALRPELVRAVIAAESAFDPRAQSPQGAIGLMQLMPATAAELGVEDPWDPEENIRGGAAYLALLLDRYGGNEELALAAYNAGPGAVERYGARVPPYRETRAYLARIRSSLDVRAFGRTTSSGTAPAAPPAGRSGLAVQTTIASPADPIVKTLDRDGDRLIPRYTNLRLPE